MQNLPAETGATICTICPVGCTLKVTGEADGQLKVEGNSCRRGRAYAIKEFTSPERTLTSIMAAGDGTMVPVKTDKPIPKEKISECMKIINEKTLMLPISLGNIIIEKIGGTEANLICTRSFINK